MQTRGLWTLGRGFGPMGRWEPLCWSPDDPPVPPPAPTPPPPPKRWDPITFETKESFDERMDREARARIKQKYGMTDKELDDRFKRAGELEAAEEARAKAQRTKEEQLELEKKQAEEARAKAETQAAEANALAATVRACATLGIKNVDYALFEVSRAGKTGTDAQAHLAELLKDDAKKLALGIAATPIEPVPDPLNTAPKPPTPPAPPPPPGGGNPAPVDVFAMSPQQFQTHLSTLK